MHPRHKYNNMEPEKVGKIIESMRNDNQAKQILKGTFFQSKSIVELSKIFGIPIPTCSEKVQALEQMEMLICDHSIATPQGSSIKYFRSDTLNTHVIYKPNDVFLRFEVMPKIPHSYPRWITVKLS